MEPSISSLMFDDHQKILGRLQELETGISNKAPDIPHLFDQFKWRLEMHMFIEERAIFTNTEFSIKSSEMVKRVTGEHKVLLEMLQSLERRLMSGYTDLVIDDLKGGLDEHKTFEETELYPRLDEELDPQAKRFIIERLNTRLLSGQA